MSITSIVAIYFLFLAGTAFILLPFGVTTTEEVGADKIPGQAESAPHQFDAKRHFLKSAVVAAILFGIYYANWTFGWITPADLDFYDPSQAQQTNS